MTGAINKGDIIIVKKLNTNEIDKLKEGNILVFNYSGKVIVHRITKIVLTQNEKYFYTKGDNNVAEDGYPIRQKDIIGVTTLRMPYLGYPTVWLNELIEK
jgi:signal peptidase